MTEGAVHTQVDGSFFWVMIYSLAAWIRFLTDSAGWIRHATEAHAFSDDGGTFAVEIRL